METLLQYLINNSIPKKIAEKFISNLNEKSYPKESLILSMGEHTNTIYFILKGLVRGYYIDENGNEITKCFAKENDWCCVYNMLTDSPSEFYIETLEDSTFVVININELNNILSTFPQLQKLYSSFIADGLIQKEKRNLYFQGMTAKERYILFAKEHPDLIYRVNQEYIASYIGITKTSLSRLKRNL